MKYQQNLTLAVIVAAIGLLALPQVVSAQAAVTRTPFSFSQFIPCANGGEGEMVTFEGTIKRTVNVVEDANGCYHVVLANNPQGISGTGETTGDTYRATGNYKASYQDYYACGETCEITVHQVDNYRLIGPGPGNNYILHISQEYIYNVCTDTWTDVRVQTKVECK